MLQVLHRSSNATLYIWLKSQLTAIQSDYLPEWPATAEIDTNRLAWERWWDGLSVKATLPKALPLGGSVTVTRRAVSRRPLY